MKKWRFLALIVLALMLWSGAAASAPLEHYAALTTYGDKIYALVSKADYNPDLTQDYHPSKIVEFNAELVKQRELVLQNGADAARNSLSLALHNGRLYIGNSGGMMGDEDGDVWEVDIANWTASRILYMGAAKGISGLEITADGTTFLLTGGYDENWDFAATLYVTTIAALSAGDSGTAIPISSGGYSWGITWSGFDQTLWVMAGAELQARSKAGALLRTFSPSELGNNIYRMGALEGETGLFYTASDYVTTSVGLITKTGSDYTAQKDLLTNLGGDTAVFTFSGHRGGAGVLLREYNYGTDDTVFIYDTGDFSSPIVNVSNWGSNINAITTHGSWLYFGTFESYEPGSPNQLSGELGRVDMSDWRPDVTPKPEPSGGGCDSGFGAAVLLLLIPITLRKYRGR